MADALATANAAVDTASPTGLNGYAVPPNWKTRRDSYTQAFANATNRLDSLQTAAYKKAGFIDGTGQLDTANQYGDIQQLLHAQGQDMLADDAAEAHRGFGLDSGLAGQRARLINYASGAKRSDYGVGFNANIADLGSQRVNATQDELTGIQGVASDKATWDGQTNYDNWLSSQAIAPVAGAPPAAADPAVPYTAWGAPDTGTGPGGYNPLAPQNKALTGTVAKKAAPAKKKTTLIGRAGGNQ